MMSLPPIRLFIGIPIDRSATHIIQQTIDDTNIHIRWIPSTNWHITITPPWHTTSDEVPLVKRQLQTVGSASSPFQATISTIQPFPDKGPHYIWAKIAPSPRLNEIKQNASHAFPNPKNTQPFKPHITLSRLRNKPFEGLNPIALNCPMTINKLILYQSFGSSQRPYRILHETLLNA